MATMLRKLGGRGRLMLPAVVFAEEHGFTVGLTQSNHLAFSGHGTTVFGAGTPRSGRAAAAAISKMKAILRGGGRRRHATLASEEQHHAL